MAFQARQMRRIGRRAATFTAMLVLLLIAAVVGYFVPAGLPLTGRATAVDGDTLRLGGDRIRLVGIDAPELEQDCTDASGTSWWCGRVARTRMVELLRGGDIDCRQQGHDRYGRILARCAIGGADLGQSMVRAGLAVADGDYFAEEAEARNDKTGIWAGLFIEPARWRREHGIGAGGEGQGVWAAMRNWFR